MRSTFSPAEREVSEGIFVFMLEMDECKHKYAWAVETENIRQLRIEKVKLEERIRALSQGKDIIGVQRTAVKIAQVEDAIARSMQDSWPEIKKLLPEGEIQGAATGLQKNVKKS